MHVRARVQLDAVHAAGATCKRLARSAALRATAARIVHGVVQRHAASGELSDVALAAAVRRVRAFCAEHASDACVGGDSACVDSAVAYVHNAWRERLARRVVVISAADVSSVLAWHEPWRYATGVLECHRAAVCSGGACCAARRRRLLLRTALGSRVSGAAVEALGARRVEHRYRTEAELRSLAYALRFAATERCMQGGGVRVLEVASAPAPVDFERGLARLSRRAPLRAGAQPNRRALRFDPRRAFLRYCTELHARTARI